MRTEAGTFCLSRQVIASEGDIQSAELGAGSKTHPAAAVTSKEKAAKRMLEITSRNIGNRMGALIKGRLVTVPMIVAPVSGCLTVVEHLTAQEADDLVRALNKQASQP